MIFMLSAHSDAQHWRLNSSPVYVTLPNLNRIDAIVRGVFCRERYLCSVGHRLCMCVFSGASAHGQFDRNLL